MASTRSRRSNAGSKMASLLNEEEKEAISGKDEFYETKYGGFQEEKDDGDFAYQSPGEDDDKVDSDFSIDEDDEVRSDIEDEGGDKRKMAKRGEGVQTKAYKGSFCHAYVGHSAGGSLYNIWFLEPCRCM